MISTRPLRTAFLPLFLAAAAAAPSAVAAPDASPATPSAGSSAPAALPADADALAHADRDFALRLYATQRDRTGNLFFSPASARVALAMTYAGARGETATQMAKALGFAKDAAHVSADYGAIVRGWNDGSDPGVQLHVVNRLWGQRGKAFAAPFLSVLADRFGAPLERVDFVSAADASRCVINAWVEGKTEHRIKDLLAPGDVRATTRLVLTNATYFKAAWLTPFAKERTSPAPFRVAPGTTVQAPTMHEQGSFAYGELPEAKLLSLPYGKGGMSMLVVLPNDSAGLSAFERSLDVAWLDKALARMSEEHVSVALPKFTTTARLSLKSALSALGMPIAFDDQRADFGGIDGGTAKEERLYLADVIQKAFVVVDEKGTEAAAATAVIVAAPSAVRAPQKTFHADHPFLYFVRDASGNVLFMGRVTDPTK